jgi:hypothetical protein
MSNPELNQSTLSTVTKAKKKTHAAKIIDRPEVLQVETVDPSDQPSLFDQTSLESPVTVTKQSKEQTIELATRLPENWLYTPVDGKKAPKTKDWYENGFSKSAIIQELKKDSKWRGIGVLCGTANGGLLFLDRDGASCDSLIPTLSGVSLEESLPITAVVTSGKIGRCQHIYQVPEEYWAAIKKTVIETGVIGPDGKAEQLEFRWDGHQSVVCGEHPETGSYKWVNHPSEAPIAIAPLWMIEQMLTDKAATKQPSKPVQKPVKVVQNTNSSIPTLEDIRQALGYLRADCCYDEWRAIGMALHSQDANLLGEWDRWSAGSAEKYKAGECETKWASFGPGSINIYKLFQLAKGRGYQASKSIDVEVQKIDVPANSARPFNPRYQDEVEDFTAETFEDTKIAINKRREINQRQGVLKAVLDGTVLGSIVTTLTEGSGVPFEASLSAIMPLYAPLIGNKGKIRVNRKTSWVEYFIFYLAFCAGTSQAKTPITAPLAKPLREFETNLIQAYVDSKKQYDLDLEEYNIRKKEKVGSGEFPPDKPVDRSYLMEEFTFESFKGQIVSQPGSGISVFVDELKGVFECLNQYRKGSDFQNLLSWWSGGGVNRRTNAHGRQFLGTTGNSFSGTIQPPVLKELRKEIDPDDSAGFWYRWLVYNLPTDWKFNLEEDEYDDFDLGYECDRLLGNLIKTWDSWGDFELVCKRGTGKWLDDRITDSIISPEYRGKLKAYAVRFAGFIACVEATKEPNSSPPTQLDPKFVKMGLDMAKYYHLQNEVAFSTAGSCDELLEKIQVFVSKKGSATVGVLKNKIRTLSKTPNVKISDLCEKCSIAYPTLTWDGRTLKLK